MALRPGTTLGSYQITAEIGAGGMGIVLRARDTTLDRDVALKVLPEAFTADPDRLARFERLCRARRAAPHASVCRVRRRRRPGRVREGRNPR